MSEYALNSRVTSLKNSATKLLTAANEVYNDVAVRTGAFNVATVTGRISNTPALDQ